jgi:hypothetical protein
MNRVQKEGCAGKPNWRVAASLKVPRSRYCGESGGGADLAGRLKESKAD